MSGSTESCWRQGRALGVISFPILFSRGFHRDQFQLECLESQTLPWVEFVIYDKGKKIELMQDRRQKSNYCFLNSPHEVLLGSWTQFFVVVVSFILLRTCVVNQRVLDRAYLFLNSFFKGNMVWDVERSYLWKSGMFKNNGVTWLTNNRKNKATLGAWPEVCHDSIL